MDQLLGLFLDRGHYSRVRMADGEAYESGVEVDELVPIHIFDYASMPALGSEWVESYE